MKSVTASICDLINTDSTITVKLASYNFGAGDQPAIFTVEPAPEDCASPLIVITPVGGTMGTARDRTHKGGEANIDVKVWGDKGDSERELREIADLLWLLIDRAALTVEGAEVVNCRADPPQRLTDPDGFPGYLVMTYITIRVEE